MDKNQIIGLTLIFLLLMVYFQFFAPEPAPIPPEEKAKTEAPLPDQAREDKSPPAKPSTPVIEEVPDSIKDTRAREKYGIFYPLAEGTEKTITVENEDIIIEFSTLGANVKKVILKKHATYDEKPLVLIDQESKDFSFQLPTLQKFVNLSELYFTTSTRDIEISNGDTIDISFRAQISPGKFIEKTYSLAGKGYQLPLKIKAKGLDQYFSKSNAEIIWHNRMKRFERDLETSRNVTTVNYYTAGGHFDYLSESSTEFEEESFEEPIKWVAFKQRFFTSSIIAEKAFPGGSVNTDVDPDDSTTVKKASAFLQYPMDDLLTNGAEFKFYFGPNNYQILKKVTAGFSENVYLGWMLFSWFNKFLIIPIFNFLENYIGNYGIIIIILVFIVKVILSPLSYKSYVSMAKQKVLKPEIDELKEKYGQDMQKMQQEQMKLFQQVGVNPLSGCIPMLLQMPILLAMFNFFPNSIELRQEGFLWAHDLSTYDSVLDLPFTIPFYGDHVSLFTLLMTLSTILYTWSNNQMTTVQGPMKSMTYVMPVMIMFFLNSFSAGLTFYYFVQNLVTFGQQAIIKKYFIDEEKIRAKLEENRKRNRNKKKSKFQMRIEEAMKNAERSKKKKQIR